MRFSWVLFYTLREEAGWVTLGIDIVLVSEAKVAARVHEFARVSILVRTTWLFTRSSALLDWRLAIFTSIKVLLENKLFASRA